MYGKDAYINPDATDEEIHDWVDEQERTNEHYKKWQKNFIDSFDDIGKSTNVGDDNTKHFSSRRGTLPKGKESVSDNPNLKRLRESKKKPVKDYSGRTDLTEEEAKKLPKYKSHKSKYTSWNRMDAGVRNEHRNTLGLSSIADYDQLPSADQKKVKDAGFWKENLKEQPIKEGTHFGNTGTTPELEAEKRTTEAPKPPTGKAGSLRRRKRLGKSLGELKILTEIVKLASGDQDIDRVQHSNTPKFPKASTLARGTAATSSLTPAVPSSDSPWKATPEKPQQSGGGGALPKTTGRGAASNIASPQQGTGSGNKGVASQGHDKKDYEMDDITRKKIPSKEEKQSNQKIRGGLGRFKDRMRDRAGKKLGTAKRKLEGFASGYQDRQKPTSGGADPKINRVTPHNTNTQGDRSDAKSPAAPKEDPKPRASKAPTSNRKGYKDPVGMPKEPTENDPTPETSVDATHRESKDEVDFKREEVDPPTEETQTSGGKKTTSTRTGRGGKKGGGTKSTRRGRGNYKRTYNPSDYMKLRREARENAKKQPPSKSTRRGRGGGRARFQRGDDSE